MRKMSKNKCLKTLAILQINEYNRKYKGQTGCKKCRKAGQ